MHRQITARLLLSAVALPSVGFAVLLAGCSQQSGVTTDRSVAAPLTPSPLAVKTDSAPRIKIISGELVFDRSPETRSIELKGTQGFRLSARFLNPAFAPEYQCTPCVPGDTVALDAQMVGLDLEGTVELHGKTYRLGTLASDATAALVFRGQGVTVPALSAGETITLSAAFELVATDDPASSTSMLRVPGAPPVLISGGGIARLEFERLTDVWEITRAVYQFDH